MEMTAPMMAGFLVRHYPVHSRQHHVTHADHTGFGIWAGPIATI